MKKSMTANKDIDWAELAPRAAVALLGQPDRKSGAEWRWSGRGGLTLNVRGQYAGRFHVWSEGDETMGLLDIIRRETGADPMQWLADAGLVRQPERGPPRVTAPDRGKSQQTPTRRSRPQLPPRDPAAEWGATSQIPASGDHPALRWLAEWNVWRQGHPLPRGLRWQSAADSTRSHTRDGRLSGHHHPGAGNIAVLMSTLTSWAAAWPEIPQPSNLHLIALDGLGRPSLDCEYRNRHGGACGIGKRTIAKRNGEIFLVGNPVAQESAPRVVEGVKDAMAVASRYPGPVCAVLGGMGQPAPDLVSFLSHSPSPAVIHADNDAGGGRAGARQLAAAVMAAGGLQPVIRYAPEGKDVADTAKNLPFAKLDLDLSREYAETLRETQDWPEWEIIRQTALALQEDD